MAKAGSAGLSSQLLRRLGQENDKFKACLDFSEVLSQNELTGVSVVEHLSSMYEGPEFNSQYY